MVVMEILFQKSARKANDETEITRRVSKLRLLGKRVDNRRKPPVFQIRSFLRMRHERRSRSVTGASSARVRVSVQDSFPPPHASLVTMGCEAGGASPRVRQARRQINRRGKDRTGEC